MTAPIRHSVRLSEPGELIAAVPHMLGFHPHDSLVLIALAGQRGRTLSFTMRADLPPPEQYRELAERLVPPIRGNGAHAVCLALVGGDPPARAPTALGDLPHGGLVDAVEEAFASESIPLAHAVWVAEIRRDAPWYCYDDVLCRGRLADPKGSALAAASAAAGVVTFASRRELAESLDPVDEAVLARRSAMLNEPPDAESDVDSRHHALALDEAIDTHDEHSVPTDEQVVRLARALGDHLARDVCLEQAGAERQARAERLWTTLVRHTPAPERAEAAALLAFSAYLRGDGALAGIALDIGESADPTHELSKLLREVLDRALPPSLLVEIATTSARQARAEIDPHGGAAVPDPEPAG